MAIPSPARPQYRAIASRRHFFMMLLIQAVLVAIGFWLQHRSGSDSVIPEHRNVAWLYLWIMALEWGLVATVRGGVKAQGHRLSDIVGGRWNNWREVVRDFALCVPFLLVWFAAARVLHRLLGPDSAKSISDLLPQRTVEIVLWIALSISAGICEEIVFRGYFQMQFAAYSNSMIAAVLLQGALFGVGHSYQGLKQVVIISVLGMFYGGFAAWRRSLRPNMLSHAWTDIWSGWLSSVLR
jgi:uncharacterized protein